MTWGLSLAGDIVTHELDLNMGPLMHAPSIILSNLSRYPSRYQFWL